jgi:hypothetical protein
MGALRCFAGAIPQEWLTPIQRLAEGVLLRRRVEETLGSSRQNLASMVRMNSYWFPGMRKTNNRRTSGGKNRKRRMGEESICSEPQPSGKRYKLDEANTERAVASWGHGLEARLPTGEECKLTILRGCEMDEKHRLAGFKALTGSLRTNSHYLEESDGSLCLWRDLSAEGRLAYIVRDAAYYNVHFEAFVEV